MGKSAKYFSLVVNRRRTRATFSADFFAENARAGCFRFRHSILHGRKKTFDAIDAPSPLKLLKMHNLLPIRQLVHYLPPIDANHHLCIHHPPITMLQVLPQPPPLKSSGVLASALVAILAAIALVSPPVVVGTSAVSTSGSADVPVMSTSTAANSGILREGQTIVESRWWTGQYPIAPSRFTIDGKGSISKDDVYNPDSDLAREIREKYEDVGLVYITNTGLTDMADQRALSRIIMGAESEYEGGANSRNRNSELANVYDIGAPIEAALAYHHEMTYKSHSIETLGFLCKHAVNRDDVGWSYVSDSVQAHDWIMQTPFGQKLKEKGLCFVRRMTDATKEPTDEGEKSKVYNHWQQSWMTNDPVEAQEKAEEQGLTVEWVDDPEQGLIMLTKYYKSAFEYVPYLDRNIMVTSIADDDVWFDSWPGIMDMPPEERPLEMFFGDDEPITLEEKQVWTDAYDLFGIPLKWQEGDVAVLDNMRYAHGRPGIHLLPGEQRELGVVLGKHYDLQQHRDDKWTESDLLVASFE